MVAYGRGQGGRATTRRFSAAEDAGAASGSMTRVVFRAEARDRFDRGPPATQARRMKNESRKNLFQLIAK
jgi:hypothetical protein